MYQTPARTFSAILLATTAMLFFAAAAEAQTDVTLLDRIVVEAESSAAVETTTGSKIAVAVTEVPQSVSVVSREQIDVLPGSKADEVLRYKAGLNASTYGTDADTDWMYIRGFQADQSGVFLDGLPLYQTGFGTFLVDPFLLDHIEVLKGPASVLYGGASVGGIVNYVSKRPTGERLRYTEVGINNFGNAYVGFDVGDGSEDGALAYRMTGKLSGGGYQTDYSEDLRGNIATSVELSPTAATDLVVYGSFQSIDLVHTSTGFLPYVGTVVDAPGVGRIPRDLFYGEPDSDDYDRLQTMIGYSLDHDIDGNWTVRQNARYASVTLEEDYVYSGGNLVGTMLPRYRFGHDTQVDIFGIDNQIEGQGTTGPLEHTLLAGLDYKYYHINERQGFSSAPSLDVLDPAYGASLADLSYYRDDDITMNQVGVYLQDQIRAAGWIATLNSRYDWVSTQIDNHLDPSLSTQMDEGSFSGRIGLGYEFSNGLTPYVSYSTSFNPTLSTDADGNLFEAETGRQWEAGLKYEPAFFDGLITASVFDLTRDNVVGPDPDNPLVQAAVGEVNMRGAELEAQVNVDDFKIIGALSYLEAEVIEATGSTPAGNSPTQIPNLTASLWVDYTVPDGLLEGLTLGAGVRYQGESWADDANTLEVPSATVFDAALSYERDDWGGSLKVSNLFDTAYVASCLSPTSCGYRAGRAATLSIHKSW